ncbi:hypothetical protein BU23DRAFT_663852 [Bimuria novae-zelandiae CBS 107.79]|uniref:Tautomerase cis-CaaD-like domain-containing protein n=1 Tax=Bimuria novae-zelandiae CBS 107.79 TaxID=1447943 RepID=A0A6A5UMX8_9PLEO|nr:hypothetical protein BU23DRAFT_663852 [Bimuria novae-zelandiae CBS 107.79]
MPLYEVFHTCSLSSEQQEKIAEGITNLHCSTFATPSLFVHVVFHEYNYAEGDQGYAKTVFVGGRKVCSFQLPQVDSSSSLAPPHPPAEVDKAGITSDAPQLNLIIPLYSLSIDPKLCIQPNKTFHHPRRLPLLPMPTYPIRTPLSPPLTPPTHT